MDYYKQKTEDVLKSLGTSKIGLSLAKVKARQQEYGVNELPAQKRFSAWRIFFRQFNNILILILLISSGIAFLFQEWLDLIVILLAVFLNVIVGFIQENKAERALENLNKIVVLKNKVIRDGKEYLIDSVELVPGDIITLEAGDQIGADARLIESNNIHTSEAILTGESSAVLKQTKVLNSKKNVLVAEQKNMLFKGTLVTEGKGVAVVTATGLKTEMGKIADMLISTEEGDTPLQKKINVFSKQIGLAILIIASIIMVVGMAKGISFQEVFMIAIAVAVSAIPEGLVVSITVTLIVGMQRILKKQALVRKLVAAETLGSTNVICVDKTGTLTKGAMKIVKILTDKKEMEIKQSDKFETQKKLNSDIKTMVEYSLLCNNAFVENTDDPVENWKYIGSPTEKSIAELLAYFNIDLKKLQTDFPRIEELPFDSYKKRMVTVHKLGDNQKLIIQKGAPERIIEVCQKIQVGNKVMKLSDKKRKELQENLQLLSSQGYRLLATCYKKEKSNVKLDQNNDFIWLGSFAIIDPLRSGVKKTIATAQAAGMRTIMITGDYKLTAKAIAGQVGLSVSESQIITGDDLDKLSEPEFKKKIEDINVYARVTPEHKLRIVNMWKSLGQVVAMTGDGVNDAPALKTADIGIAVGSGSDVTKSTADMVLLDNNFSVIIEAIRQGRMIFANIKKIIVYLLADSFSAVVLVFGSLLMGLPLPITAAQILWINLLTDGFPAAALTVEKSHDDVMKQKPIPKDKPVLDKDMKVLIFVIGLFVDLILLSLFYYMYNAGVFHLEYIRTIIFSTLSFATLLYVFSCKSLHHSILKIKLFENKYLLLAVLFGFGFQLMALYTPFFQNLFNFEFIGLKEWIVILSLAFVKLFLIELTKYIYSSYNNKETRLWKF